jgi:MoxR-like ATPase
MNLPARKYVEVDMSKVPPKNRVLILRHLLNKIMFEREQAIDVILASCITGLPVCLYGWPGTGKTMIIELIAKATSGKYAYVLGNQTMKSSELTGIPDMKRLREKSELHYNTKDRIFDADLGFLDEAGKAPSYALNLILRAMKEKRGPNNEEINLTLFFASSEPIQSPAFLDRIVMSLWFDDVKEAKSRRALKLRDAGLEYTPEMPEGFLDPSDFKAVKELVETEVAVTDEVLSILNHLESTIYIDKLSDSSADIPTYRISTRKMLWIPKMLCAVAWLRGMKEVTLELIAEIYPLALLHDPAHGKGAVAVVAEVIQDIIATKERLEKELTTISNQLANVTTQKDIPELDGRLQAVNQEITEKSYCNYLLPQIEELESRLKTRITGLADVEASQLFMTIEDHCKRNDLYLDDWNEQTAEILKKAKKTKVAQYLKGKKKAVLETLRQEAADRNGIDIQFGSGNGHVNASLV